MGESANESILRRGVERIAKASREDRDKDARIATLEAELAAALVKIGDAEWLFERKWLPLKCKVPADHYSIECRAQTIKALMRGPLWEAIRAARERGQGDG